MLTVLAYAFVGALVLSCFSAPAQTTSFFGKALFSEEDSVSFLRRRLFTYRRCDKALWDVNRDTLRLQTDPEAESLGCGAGSTECVRTWNETDWADLDEDCKASGGDLILYGELKISCNARRDYDRVGYTTTIPVSLNVTHRHVPVCLPKTECQGSYDGVCSSFPEIMANHWKDAHSRGEGYHSVECTADFQGCSTTDTTSTGPNIVAIIGSSVAAAVVLASLGIAAFDVHRKKKASNGSGSEGSDQTENETTTSSRKAVASLVPKGGFGLLAGCARDGHFKHTCLWVANSAWLLVWILSATYKGCEPSRYGGGCDVGANFENPSGFWRSGWLSLLVWMIPFNLFLVEFGLSSTHKYLSNINTSESLLDYMDRLYRTAPTLSLKIECYHMETTTEEHRDSNGNTTTTSTTSKVVTYREKEDVVIVSWEDTSKRLQISDVSEYQATKVKVTNTWDADANYEAQRKSLVERNRHRDDHHQLRVSYDVPGYKDKMLSYVDLEKKPFLLDVAWGWLAHITILLALPYRLWVSGVTGKIEAKVHKSLTTSWSGSGEKSA